MSTRLNIVVAHKLEAQPLLQLFDLQAASRSPAIFSNNDGLRLIVSGEGIPASEAAVNFLGQDLGQDGPNTSCAAWLNVGIAGHQSAAIGEAGLINKIVCRDSSEVCYPIPLTNQPILGELHTVAEPEFSFPENVAYDMEGAGFFAAAKRYTTLELIQCFKIVSDNVDQDASTVTRERVVEVITSNKEKIQQLVQALLELQQHYQEIAGDVAGMEELAARVHLTATQRVQLRRLLQRFQAFGLELELAKLTDKPGLDARRLIAELNSHLQGVNR